MKALIKKFIRGEEGLETVEYGVMAALIVLAAVVAITALGGKISSTFDTVATKLP